MIQEYIVLKLQVENLLEIVVAVQTQYLMLKLEILILSQWLLAGECGFFRILEKVLTKRREFSAAIQWFQ